ncbi:RNA polymerase Rpc34 subunit-domain-containing protein [Kockovaella imperatae]|uniref:RNA polymerase Rpc34 subunit-domain-containing protein n=1 Tax=Kockovaella imperatae TaxID=4999 RepID=A0A1Y1ULK4_9TREE|nr:RNA polymerase Rpc34 subunit-domain-containing protein [Kockovaella imperatae]ORX38930.1 RNA polymerase Rpc34 subunit-domain-containing protein [Kockovaella imperatae]
MATLSTSDQQVWKKVLSAKGQSMTQAQIEQSLPGMPRKEVQSSVTQLMAVKLLRSETSKEGGAPLFHAVQPKDAKKKQALTSDQNMVLKMVSQAGRRGIAQKTLRVQIGADTIPTTILRKTLDSLEKSGHIASFKSIHQPTVSLYILPNVKPAEDLTGGVWYDGQKEYDAEFVNGITMFLYDKVKSLTFPSKDDRNPAHAKLVPNAIYPVTKTKKLPTPHTLLAVLKRSGLTQAKLKVENVMECMRALELDGLIEAVKPVGGVSVPDVVEDSDGEGPSRKKRRMNNDDDTDEDELDLRKEKAKELAKEKKRKEKVKLLRKQRAEKKAKEKEKRAKKRAKKKEKEKDRERRRKEKRKRKARSESDDSEEDLDADSDELVTIDQAFGKGRKKGRAEDDEETDSDRDERRNSKKKSKRQAAQSDSEDSDDDSEDEGRRKKSKRSNKRKARSPVTSSESEDSESDVDSDDVSVSSVDSADIDLRDVALKPKSSAIIDSSELQTIAFARTGLGELNDVHVAYRATNLVNLPLGQTQISCGKCPQFNFCQEDGPVNPESCAYVDDWLADVVGGWDPEGRKKYRDEPTAMDTGDQKDGMEASGIGYEEDENMSDE